MCNHDYLRRSFEMENFNEDTLPTDEESLSSPSSTSSSSDDNVIIPGMAAYVQYQQQVQQQMMFLTQSRHAPTEMTSSASTPRIQRRCIRRDREAAHNRLNQDYFTEDSVYNEHHFRRRFRMRRHLFVRIVETLDNHSEYFQVRYNVAGKRGLSPLTKCTTTI